MSVAEAIAPTPFPAKVCGVVEAGNLALSIFRDYSCGTAPDSYRLPPLSPELALHSGRPLPCHIQLYLHSEYSAGWGGSQAGEL